MNQPKKDSYHHGNLKQALLDTALAALEAESLEKLSLRGIAKTLGVTPTAVYGHFTDKVALLVALRTIGFEELGCYLRNASSGLPEGEPEARVRALGRAYLAFAREKPNLFDTVFGWTPDFDRITTECVEAGLHTEQILRNAMIELVRAQGCELNDYQSAVAAFSAWSLVHGISMLLNSGSVEGIVYCEEWPDTFSARNPVHQARVIDHLMSIHIAGLKAISSDLHDGAPA